MTRVRGPNGLSRTGHDNKRAAVDLDAVARWAAPQDLADLILSLVQRSPHAAELARVLPARLATLTRTKGVNLNA